MPASLLLNWRLWAALAFMAAEAWAGYKLHHAGYEQGREEVQGLFDAYRAQSLEQAMAAQVAANAKEAAMVASNREVTANYESLQAATGTAVRALDADRVRLQAAIAAHHGQAPGDTSAGLPADAAPEVGILSQCIDRYAAMAGDADRLSDQVKALQDYVTQVVQAPPAAPPRP